MPLMTFAHLKPININVAQVDVTSDYEGGNAPFFVAPDEAVQRYFYARYRAVGSADFLKVSIEQSSVTKSYARSGSDIGRYFKVGGIDRYEVDVSIRLEHETSSGQVLYGKRINLKRIINVPEHDSLSKREKRQFEGLEILFQDLDREVQRVILEEMSL